MFLLAHHDKYADIAPVVQIIRLCDRSALVDTHSTTFLHLDINHGPYAILRKDSQLP